MHGVVLLLHVVEVTGVLINSVIAEHVLEKEEGVVVRVLDGRGIVEDGNIAVNHFVVADEEHGGNVDGSLYALNLARGRLGKAVKGVGDLANELVVVDVASTNNHKVVTEVVGSVEVTNVIN